MNEELQKEEGLEETQTPEAVEVGEEETEKKPETEEAQGSDEVANSEDEER